MKTNQKQRIIQYLKDFGSITGRDAYLDLGIQDFQARMSDLRNDGYRFKSKWEESKNRYGEKVVYKRYYLENGIEMDNLNHIPMIY